MLISKSSVKLCEVSDTILHDTLPILKYAGSISKKVQMLTGTNDFIYMIHISGNCEIRPQICVNLPKGVSNSCHDIGLSDPFYCISLFIRDATLPIVVVVIIYNNLKPLPILYFRLLTEDPIKRLGAKGATEVDFVIF